MRKSFAGLVVIGALAAPVSATAAPDNPKAYTNCALIVVSTQSANGTSAGGGPKEGVLAPTNCDHFYGGAGDGGVGP